MEKTFSYDSETRTLPSDPESCRVFDITINITATKEEYSWEFESILCRENGERFSINDLLEPDKTNITRMAEALAANEASNVYQDWLEKSCDERSEC